MPHFFDEALSDFLIVPTEEALLAHSFDLILGQDLRTLDSIQLSAALAVSNQVDEMAFVSADQELVSVAEDRGLETLNPDTDDENGIIDDSSYLEEHFADASRLFRIFENGEIDVRDEFEDASWQARILIHLVGQRYAYESGKTESLTLSYDYFYALENVRNADIRTCVKELENDHIVEQDKKTNEWKVVPDNLPKAFSRIETLK